MNTERTSLDTLADWVTDYQLTPRLAEQGVVESVGDGIAWVRGLPSAAAEDVLRFEEGSRGLVFELQSERLGVIMLDTDVHVASGTRVARSGDRLELGVGDALLGRVIDPLGRALDGLPPPETDATRRLESPSPSILARDYVNRPLYTGIKVIDTLIPIGRGQRQLIIGDAGSGKTSLALDTVVAQAGQGVKCVYVMIGQKRAEVATAIDLLRRQGALAYTTLVVGEASAMPGMNYLSPFAGAALAEYWMNRGEDTLVIYDDLSTHARAYRELSLLMHRPPGREAYPGDIFYLHARLLERATRLCAAQGGGSLTALPLVETEEGEIAAYIPTNLISITDGQIYLDRRLFVAGMLPAVDVPLSVSRIGGKAQHPRIKEEAGRMKLDYLQFLELEVFTRFGAKLEAGAEAKIRRGRVLREILKQERLSPVSAGFQLAWLIAYNQGCFDRYAPREVAAALKRLEQGLVDAPPALESATATWLARIRTCLEAPS